MKNYNNNDSYCWFCRDKLGNLKEGKDNYQICKGCFFI